MDKNEKLAKYLYEAFGRTSHRVSWEDLPVYTKDLYRGHADQILDVVLK